MSWHALPTELQEGILAQCVQQRSAVLSLLLASRQTSGLVVPLLYTQLHLASLPQLRALVAAAGGVDALEAAEDDGDAGEAAPPAAGSVRAHLAAHTRRLTISIDGVPGAAAANMIEREDSPFRLWSGQLRRVEKSEERLSLAACVMRLCDPRRLTHVALEMYGVRSKTVLGEPALEEALGRLYALRSLRWVPPGRPGSVVGFSIAVVDSVVPSIQRGLLEAALRGPTQQSALQELHFAAAGLPSAAEPSDTRLSFLWALSCQHAADGRALFPHLRSLRFSSAVNVPAAPLARLMLHRALAAATAAPDTTQPLRIDIADGFSGSIWGPRLVARDFETHMRRMLISSGAVTLLDGAAPPAQQGPPIQILSEPADFMPEVSEPSFAACAGLPRRELEALLASALGMLHLTELEGGIAGRTDMPALRAVIEMHGVRLAQ